MSDEHFFQERLDESHADSAARWLFAEWLEERGDWRTFGYHWMACHAKYPERTPSARDFSWDWWSTTVPGIPQYDLGKNHEYLEPSVFGLLRGYSYHSDWSNGIAYREYFTREAAEEELFRALYAVSQAPR